MKVCSFLCFLWEWNRHLMSPLLRYLDGSVTRLGHFWKVLLAKFRTKVAQISDDFWGNFENHFYHLNENHCCNFWATFYINWATYWSLIRSHCLMDEHFDPIVTSLMTSKNVTITSPNCRHKRLSNVTIL